MSETGTPAPSRRLFMCTRRSDKCERLKDQGQNLRRKLSARGAIAVLKPKKKRAGTNLLMHHASGCCVGGCSGTSSLAAIVSTQCRICIKSKPQQSATKKNQPHTKHANDTCRNNVSNRATVGCNRAIVAVAAAKRSSCGDTRTVVSSMTFANRASSRESSSSPERDDSSDEADTTPMRRPFKRFCSSSLRLLRASVLSQK